MYACVCVCVYVFERESARANESGARAREREHVDNAACVRGLTGEGKGRKEVVSEGGTQVGGAGDVGMW